MGWMDGRGSKAALLLSLLGVRLGHGMAIAGAPGRGEGIWSSAEWRRGTGLLVLRAG